MAFTSFDAGNPAGNVIPSKATLKFNVRYSPEHDFASLKAWAAGHVDAVQAELSGKWNAYPWKS